MRFCQSDGTSLVEVADAAKQDPFKTTVGNQDEISSAIPLDPFKTMVAPPPQKKEKEVLELPEEPDFLKTMVSSPQVGKKNEPSSEKDEIQNTSPTPSPFGDAVKSESSGDKFSFGGKNSAADDAVPQADPGYSPVGENPSGLPIPSPFEESMVDYQAPSKPMPSFDEPEPIPVGGNDPFQSPFNQPHSPFEIAEVKAEALNTPYAEQVEEQQNQPLEQANWTPPPAPDANWQNQQIGQNTPFQPPPAGQAQNQTLPIVSLVLGIMSLCCYVSPLTGIGALVTGYLGMKNANTDPANYGGKTLAIVGMILGGLFLLIGIAYWIFILVFGIAGFIPQ